MNKLQHLLSKAAEESSEIAKASIKAQIFGLDDGYPGTDRTNRKDLHAEIDDLLATIELLNEEHDFGYVPDRAAWDKKKQKIKQYMEYSRRAGLLI